MLRNPRAVRPQNCEPPGEALPSPSPIVTIVRTAPGPADDVPEPACLWKYRGNPEEANEYTITERIEKRRISSKGHHILLLMK